MKFFYSFIFLFFCTSAWGADPYYATWEDAMFAVIMKGKVTGFYTDTNPDVCWVQIYGTKGDCYYPNPKSYLALSSACIAEYEAKGIPWKENPMFDLVTSLNSGFQTISDGLCGSLAACVCFGLLWAAILKGM